MSKLIDSAEPRIFVNTKGFYIVLYKISAWQLQDA